MDTGAGYNGVYNGNTTHTLHYNRQYTAALQWRY